MIYLAEKSAGAVDSGSLPSINKVTCNIIQLDNISSINKITPPAADGAQTLRQATASQAPHQAAASQTPRQAAASQAPRQATAHQTAASQAPRQTAVSQAPRQAAASQAPRQTTASQAPRQTAASRTPQSPAPSGLPLASRTSPQGRTAPAQGSASPRRPLPPLLHPLQKGQKAPLTGASPGDSRRRTLKVCLGWNVTNPQCDVDVSAFLLGSNGKVPGDSWFVFYGQTESPDHSTKFSTEHSGDRESITIHLDRLNQKIQKIVFVLTINEAMEKHLHFGMIEDAYIRILDSESSEELASFLMKEYYANVVSMMIGELYLHNGTWKFNAVGNGVTRDLSGLCELYGVQTDD